MDSPVDVVAEWLFYDDGVNVDGIGGPATFTWAIKFDPAQLADYDGASLTKIEIYNRTAATDELRIYEGTNAATLLHSQPLSGLAVEEWAEVNLTSPVLIDVTKQLWIGVYSTDGVNFPAAVSDYSGDPNGDLITTDGVVWEHINDLGVSGTWNLRGYVTTVAGATASIPMNKPADDYTNVGAKVAASGKPSSQKSWSCFYNGKKAIENLQYLTFIVHSTTKTMSLSQKFHLKKVFQASVISIQM